MGVPAFFRWITSRYPKILMDAFDDDKNNKTMEKVDKVLKENFNSSMGMPSIDNLYLDFNGIIHPCCHPENKPQPSTEEEMFNNIFEYTDNLVKLIKPNKVLYLAVDGVAPRAKMNQQRSRRFRSAIEAMTKKEKEMEVLNSWDVQGKEHEIKIKDHSFDNNTITPGTEFMTRLSEALKIYISHRIQFNPYFKDLTIIFSDSSVPGEGEHKILDYIRKQRTQENYIPGTSHCMYGADADLIMLSLITHEPNFYIIRESLNENQWKKCEFCGLNGHEKADCYKLNSQGGKIDESVKFNAKVEYSIIKVSVLREYLEIEFREISFNFAFDLERIIDDFVFLCFFVGNDFIPNLPSLKIREGAIDALVFIYKTILPALDGYLTENGSLMLNRIQLLLDKVSLVEETFFRQQLNYQASLERRKAENAQFAEKSIKLVEDENVMNKQSSAAINEEEIQIIDEIFCVGEDIENINSTNEENEKIKAEKNKQAAKQFEKEVKEILKKEGDKKVQEYKDNVKLGVDGWKARYYLEKFHTSIFNRDFSYKIKKAYIEGICWVYSYYYNGCPSWDWFYPFHYSPFASDLVDVGALKIEFEIGKPFKPIEQLLAVLPPYSSKALPTSLAKLMKDPDSEIADFFPTDITLDINGHPFAWMGVNLIPFIDEWRIREVVARFEQEFSDFDRKRNKLGNSIVFFNYDTHYLGKVIGKNYQNEKSKFEINTSSFPTLSGLITGNSNSNRLYENYQAPFPGLSITEIPKCSVVSLIFNNPKSIPHNSYSHKIKTFKEVFDSGFLYLPKKVFRGDRAIETVERCIGSVDSIRNNVFDRNYNTFNELSYEQVHLLQKKRYKDSNTPNMEDELRRNPKRNSNRGNDYNMGNNTYVPNSRYRGDYERNRVTNQNKERYRTGEANQSYYNYGNSNNSVEHSESIRGMVMGHNPNNMQGGPVKMQGDVPGMQIQLGTQMNMPIQGGMHMPMQGGMQQMLLQGYNMSMNGMNPNYTNQHAFSQSYAHDQNDRHGRQSFNREYSSNARNADEGNSKHYQKSRSNANDSNLKSVNDINSSNENFFREKLEYYDKNPNIYASLNQQQKVQLESWRKDLNKLVSKK